MGNSAENGERRIEHDAVRTTIVGGRPPGSGKPVGDVPRGIEVLVKKASVDPEFRRLLLEKRAAAADAIELKLTQAEETMLAAVPQEQLETIIANTHVPHRHRAAFLGCAAVAMLAVVGGLALGISKHSEARRNAAAMSEGIAGAGSIRSALRVYAAGHNNLYPVLNFVDGSGLSAIGIAVDDLDGKYLKASSYRVTSTATDYIITVKAGSESYVLRQNGIPELNRGYSLGSRPDFPSRPPMDVFDDRTRKRRATPQTAPENPPHA